MISIKKYKINPQIGCLGLILLAFILSNLFFILDLISVLGLFIGLAFIILGCIQMASGITKNKFISNKNIENKIGIEVQNRISEVSLLDNLNDTEAVVKDSCINEEVSPTFDVDTLKNQFSSFTEAKSYFGIKARGWKELANKLNGNE